MPLVRRLALLLALEGVLLVGVGVAYAVVGASSRGETLPIELAAGFAALTGLVLGGSVLFLLVLTIVWLTNRHFEGKEASEKSAVTAPAAVAPPANH